MRVRKGDEEARQHVMSPRKAMARIAQAVSDESGDLRSATGHQPHKSHCGSGHCGTCHVTSLTFIPSVAKVWRSTAIPMQVDQVHDDILSWLVASVQVDDATAIDDDSFVPRPAGLAQGQQQAGHD